MEPSSEARHHLLIAGAGRSGTTLLVRVLSGLGFDSHLERPASDVIYDEVANAGLEDLLSDENAPYVVKSPWAYQLLDHVLSSGDVVLDHAIVPIRNLRDAAASRVITELQGINDNPDLADAMERSGGMWEHFASRAGGVTYSLEPLDQERILAVGFARLIQILVQHEVPITLLDFPRFTTDPAYLANRLRPILAPDVVDEQVADVLADVVDDTKIRVGRELARPSIVAASEADRPTLEELDSAALRRLLEARRADCEQLRTESDRLRAECERLTGLAAAVTQDQPSVVGLRGWVGDMPDRVRRRARRMRDGSGR